ncbi:hepatic lectin-like [Sceloporus undulatus]|uniref:hepatic lectin-like n=1 Tax=Sceloporus undulatus TaxID=8520 RepID=UPI001C4C2E56|nr:hepatic lectin-like [Sceloporus undulatus]
MMVRVGAYERQEDDTDEEAGTAAAQRMLARYIRQWQWKSSYLVYLLLAVAYLLIIILFGIVASKASYSDLNKEPLKPEAQQDREMASCGPDNTQWVRFHGKCYYFSPEKATWMIAKKKCEAKQSQLVIIKSMAEQNFLQNRTNNQRYWIGLSNKNVEGEWKWLDGSDSTSGFTYWAPGKPNNSESGEDCAHLWNNGKWNDVYCTYPCNYICEQPVPNPRT